MNIRELFKKSVGAEVAKKAEDASAEARAALEASGNEAKTAGDETAVVTETPAETPASPDAIAALSAKLDEVSAQVAELKTANETQAKQIASFIAAEEEAAKAVDEGVAQLRTVIAEDATKAAQAILESWRKDNLPNGGKATGRQIPAASEITDDEAKAQADIAAFKARLNNTGA